MNDVTAIELFMCIRNPFPILPPPPLPNITVAFLPHIRDVPFLDYCSKYH
jgi:hypothetical protein